MFLFTHGFKYQSYIHVHSIHMRRANFPSSLFLMLLKLGGLTVAMSVDEILAWSSLSPFKYENYREIPLIRSAICPFFVTENLRRSVKFQHSQGRMSSD